METYKDKNTDTDKDMEKDIENVMRILDGFAAGGESRMKLEMDGGLQEGGVLKVHHYGRCDIGSPWAAGTCFDAGEEVCDTQSPADGSFGGIY